MSGRAILANDIVDSMAVEHIVVDIVALYPVITLADKVNKTNEIENLSYFSLRPSYSPTSH